MKFFIRDENGNEKEIESLYFDIKRTDTIVFKIPRDLSLDAKLRAKETLQELLPDNTIILLNDDIDIGVLRNE